MSWFLIFQLWTSVYDPTAIFQGSWHSCPYEDGTYAEGAYPYKDLQSGKILWTFHMGKDDFALYEGVGLEDDKDDHNSPLNLLENHWIFEHWSLRPHRVWDVKKFDIHIELNQGGDCKETCECWFVRIEKLAKMRSK